MQYISTIAYISISAFDGSIQCSLDCVRWNYTAMYGEVGGNGLIPDTDLIQVLAAVLLLGGSPPRWFLYHSVSTDDDIPTPGPTPAVAAT